jgi:hypothetical protein
MSRTALAGAVAVVAFALSGAQAFGATIQWGEDIRRGPVIWLDTAAGERVDLTMRAPTGGNLEPEEVVVENAAGPLTSPGTFPAPGSCDDEAFECTSPCRAEAPNRMRCSVYDGFTREPPRLNPYEPPYRSFGWGVWLFLSDASDRITVPADNPVRFNLTTSEPTGGAKTWDISRAKALIHASTGDVIRSGDGANLSVALWGSANLDLRNGRKDSASCRSSDPQTIRIDAYDTVTDCTGDIGPAQGPLGPAPALHEELEEYPEIASGEVARLRRTP